MKDQSKDNDSLLNKYINEIRNSTKFSEETLKQINNLNYNDRMQILQTYNEMLEYYIDLLEKL